MSTVVIADAGLTLDCPHCGTPMRYYQSSKTYYCPRKSGGCGAIGRRDNVKIYQSPQSCQICGEETTNGKTCRSCNNAWVSRCQQCDVPWKHSHLSIRECRYPMCDQTYVTRVQSSPDRERQWCSDRCKRNHYKREYDQRRKAAPRTQSKGYRSSQGRRSFDVVALALLVAQDYRCSDCGELVDLTLDYRDAMSLTVDHTIPLVLGGSDDPGNLTAMHRACNSRKGWRGSARQGLARLGWARQGKPGRGLARQGLPTQNTSR